MWPWPGRPAGPLALAAAATPWTSPSAHRTDTRQSSRAPSTNQHRNHARTRWEVPTSGRSAEDLAAAARRVCFAEAAGGGGVDTAAGQLVAAAFCNGHRGGAVEQRQHNSDANGLA